MTTATLSQRPLTPKQERFALFLFQGLSQRDAYLKAGYSPNQLPDTIDRAACGLAEHYKIVTRVKELQSQAESAAIGTVVERKKKLTEIYRATVGDFVDENGNLDIQGKDKLKTPAVAEVKTERTVMGVKTTLKLRDPIAAIQEQNRMERIGADNTPPQNINVVFLVGRGYQALPEGTDIGSISAESGS